MLTSLVLRKNRIGAVGARALAALTSLTRLDLLSNNIGDDGARALAALTGLASLNVRDNEIRDDGARALASLTALASLDLAFNHIGSDGANAIAALTGLTSLNLAYNAVGDDGARVLAALTSLTRLDLRDSRIGEIGPLLALDRLERIDLSGNPIRSVCPEFWHKPSLREAFLHEASLGDVPREVLSQDYFENCLPRLRAYLRDRAGGPPEAVRDIKVMILGNGRIGKTQICNRLRGEDFEEDALSTHGVKVHRAELPAPEASGPPTPLHIWDFGGQDIYLGTHALFLRTRAIFPIVWTPKSEREREHTYQGVTSQNFPLEYWVRYVAQMAGRERPVLLIQNQVDGPGDRRVPPKVDRALLESFKFHRDLAYSAKTERGHPTLVDGLQQAAAYVHETEGLKRIGGGWAVVKRRLEALRDAAQAAREAGRADPALGTIPKARFEELCAAQDCVAAGGVSEPDVLLDYLHQIGTVFHRPGLFGGRIIVDQQWALAAIYAVFERGSGVYRHIKETRGGRFTRSELARFRWDELGHGEPEQKLFLDMMRSCRICFQIREPGRGEPEFVAPDLLPPRADLQHRLDEVWEEDAPAERAVFPFELLPPGLLRSLMAEVGELAGVCAVYWQDGFYVHDAGTRARAIIEQVRAEEGFAGRIEVRTQRDDAAGLLAALAHLVKAHQDQLGVATGELRRAGGFKELIRRLIGSGEDADALRRAAERTSEMLNDRRGDGFAADAGALAKRVDADAAVVRATVAPRALARLSPAPEPLPERAYYVSYAWGSTGAEATAEEKRREAVVDALCERMRRAGIEIVRDRDAMRFGDRISNFMRQMSEGRRIYVVLSDKYLRSAYCMYELHRIWERSGPPEDREETFLARVRVIRLPDARISRLEDRLKYASFWEDERKRLISEVGGNWTRLGTASFMKIRLMEQFAHHTGDILDLIGDTLNPRSIEHIDDLDF